MNLAREPAGAGVSPDAHDRKPIGEYDLSFTLMMEIRPKKYLDSDFEKKLVDLFCHSGK